MLYHDGPLLRECAYPIEATTDRYDDYGHSLRDLGIKQAKGEYIIHLNADNFLYPQIADLKLTAPTYVFPIIMRGMIEIPHPNMTVLTRTGSPQDMIVMMGNPPVQNNIDAMQLVMKTSLWQKYGWWDKSESSDGKMYPLICEEYPPVFMNELLGEHY